MTLLALKRGKASLYMRSAFEKEQWFHSKGNISNGSLVMSVSQIRNYLLSQH